MSDNKSPWGQGPKKGSNGSGGNKSPWGSGNRPDRNRPKPGESSPDLENVIQGFTKRVRNGGKGPFGGGGGPDNPLNKFGPLGLFVAFGLIALLLSCIYTVDQTEEALVLRFGKYTKTAAPGLNFKLPTPIETTIKRETKVVNKTDIGGNSRTSLMLTGDENIVDINFTVLWRISDLSDFVFEVDETPVAVRAVAESAMREIVGKNKLEEIITTRRLDITLAVRDLMQETLDEYKAGVEIVEVQLQKADPPDAVVDSFRDVVNAAQDAETKVNEATAIQNNIVPVARGEAAQILQDAEAYKGRVVAEAEGEAERFKLVLEEYKAAPRVTRERIYLETIEEVYGPADKIILGDQAGSGVVPYLPLDQLGKKAAGGK